MLLIDKSYFKGELSLPNIPASVWDEAAHGVALALQTVGGADLCIFVDKYVTEYLIRLFGRELTEEFLKEIGKEFPPEIWVKLKNQLLIRMGSYKVSPLANYVYYWLMRDARTKTTPSGEADPDFDNAENVNNQYKLVKAWNDMVHMNFSIFSWFRDNIRDYEAYAGCYTGRDVYSLTQYSNTFGL
jgi:hypothetical protein